MPDYVDRDEEPLIGATSELDQAAFVEEESDLEQEQATAFSARSDVFAPLSRSRSEPNLSEQVDKIAALNGVGVPGQPGVFRPRSSSLSMDAPAAARDGQVDVAAVSSLPPPLGESGIEDASVDFVPRLPPPDEFADAIEKGTDPQTVVVLPMVEALQSEILSEAVDRRLKDKTPRPIVVADAMEARLRERLAHHQENVRSDFASFPDIIEARMEGLWRGNGALGKAVASMEIGDLPIVRTGSGALRDLPEDSKLYINGHGGDGDSSFYYSWEDGSGKELPMDAMAEWFDEASLLRERHYDIRLRMCQSACPGPNGEPSMAEQFRDAMQEAGYDKVDVSGYLGNVVSDPLLYDDGVRHYVVMDAHGDGAVSRRSENRLTFKADGSVVDSRVAKAVRNDESDEE